MRSVTSLTTNEQAPLSQVINIIESGHAQIALVTDESGALIGTITDGDVRRALLAGEGLDSPAHRYMNRSFYVTEREKDEGAASRGPTLQ